MNFEKFVWCRNCKQATEWRLDVMETKVPAMVGNGTTTWRAQDLVCKECHSIVACFHENQDLPNNTAREIGPRRKEKSK